MALPTHSLPHLRGKRLGRSDGGDICIEVYRALDPASGQLLAVKTLDLRQVGDLSGERLEELGEELRRWRDFRHPHLVEVLGHTLLPDRLHLYMEYLPFGTITSIVAQYGPLQGRQLAQVLRGCVEGVHYLHARNPALPHGCVRGKSLLADSAFDVKLSDYGYARLGFRGAPEAIPWLAPEVVQRRSEDGLKADSWSVGCTLLEVATGQSPWGADATLPAVKLALAGAGEQAAAPPIPHTLPADGRDFARLCLRRAPTDRASAAELLQHIFVDK